MPAVDKLLLWLKIVWKYLVLAVVIVLGVVAMVLLVRFLSPKADDAIVRKIEELNDQIKDHKDTLRDIDRYLERDKRGMHP